MDKITIKNLEIFANHGVFPEENVLGQKFVVSAVLYTDIREAGKSDDLTKSIHYGEVSHQIKSYVENHTFQLLERVAEGLARELLLSVPRLEGIKLEIKKPWWRSSGGSTARTLRWGPTWAIRGDICVRLWSP